MDVCGVLEGEICVDEATHGKIFERNIGGDLVDEVVDGLLGGLEVLEKGSGVGAKCGVGRRGGEGANGEGG